MDTSMPMKLKMKQLLFRRKKIKRNQTKKAKSMKRRVKSMKKKKRNRDPQFKPRTVKLK